MGSDFYLRGVLLSTVETRLGGEKGGGVEDQF